MVPCDWSHTTFEKHIDLLNGFAFKSANYSSEECDIRLLRGDNIEPGSLRWRGVKRWPVNELEKLNKFQLAEHDFVIAMDRTWITSGLKVAEVKQSDLPCLLVQRVSRIRALHTLEQSLLRQYFSGHRFEQYVKSVQTETAVPHISPSQIKEFSFLLPPLPEQRKIATILGTWDKAISTTERLIDNSKQQKKALMQQLLTGKKRLLDESGKPFEGEWENKYLHEVAQIIVSPVDKKTIEGEIPVELCNYTDVYYNTRITNELSFMKATAKQIEIDKYTLKVNDVIVTKDSETPGDIAIPALVSEDLSGVVCGYHLAIVRPNYELVEGAFLNYLFSMPKTRYYFFTLATGATRFGLSVGSINKAHFTLPPLVEQQKIAALLTNADKEIELLEQQLADLKQEKKALMQQLLTGKRRVSLNIKEDL
jgi:type I restriction enzyme S subunit